MVSQVIDHVGVRQLAPGGLTVEVRALRLAERQDLLLARQQIVKLPRLAREELFAVRVRDQDRSGYLADHVANLVLPYFGEQVEGVSHAVGPASERQRPRD